MKKINSIDEYLKSRPEKDRLVLEEIRSIIKAAAPEATETISYGMPTFDYYGHLVAFAAFKDHYSLFPMSGTYVRNHQDELKKFATAKGTIQFPADKPLPRTLIKKIVKDRMKENKAKAGIKTNFKRNRKTPSGAGPSL